MTTQSTTNGMISCKVLLALSAVALTSNIGQSSNCQVTAFTPSSVSQSRLAVPRANKFPSTSLTSTASADQEVLSATDVAAVEENKPNWDDDGFVFGLEGSGLERPTGRSSQVVVEGDSLETTNTQRAIVGVTMAGHAALASWALSQMLLVNGGALGWTSIQAVGLTLASWVLADFGSGVLHWSVDNYGNGKTPIMGSIIAGFQGHHAAPWTITERGFCNNVHKLCVPFGLAPMALIALISGPFTTFFMTTFCVFEIMSQEFHKWSHQLKSEVPNWVNKLQDLGLTISRKPHALHHLAPYEGNYCIISGICNTALDNSGFFRRLEHIVYKLNGVESNAWKLDPELREKTLSGKYAL